MGNSEESNLLLPNQDADHKLPAAVSMGWTADGLPIGPQGPTMTRSSWDTGLCACLRRTDQFFSSDLEVCLLGSVAPCVLYGSNVERFQSDPGTFANNCIPYACICLLGTSVFGWNYMAPVISYRRRIALRRKFNLEGSCEEMIKTCGCCGNVLENEAHLEQYESDCDLATHIFCHPCALCQEGREYAVGFLIQGLILNLSCS